MPGHSSCCRLLLLCLLTSCASSHDKYQCGARSPDGKCLETASRKKGTDKTPFINFVTRLNELLKTKTDQSTFMDKTSALMKALVAGDGWLPDSFASPSDKNTPSDSFTQQHLLYYDPMKRFVIISYVMQPGAPILSLHLPFRLVAPPCHSPHWGVGAKTPIHDHQMWGVVGQLRGTEAEQKWSWKRPSKDSGESALTAREILINKPGDVSLLSFTKDARYDIHNVTNVGESVAVTIQVYGGDIGNTERFTYNYPTDRSSKPVNLTFVSHYSGRLPLMMPKGGRLPLDLSEERLNEKFENDRKGKPYKLVKLSV